MRAAALAVAEVYLHSGVGGNLHIVLDDWNLEDYNLAYCDAQIANGGWKDDRPLSPQTEFMRATWPDPPDQLAAERRCHDLLAPLSIKERASALALQSNFWNISNKEEYERVCRESLALESATSDDAVDPHV